MCSKHCFFTLTFSFCMLWEESVSDLSGFRLKKRAWLVLGKDHFLLSKYIICCQKVSQWSLETCSIVRWRRCRLLAGSHSSCTGNMAHIVQISTRYEMDKINLPVVYRNVQCRHFIISMGRLTYSMLCVLTTCKATGGLLTCHVPSKSKWFSVE